MLGMIVVSLAINRPYLSSIAGVNIMVVRAGRSGMLGMIVVSLVIKVFPELLTVT